MTKTLGLPSQTDRYETVPEFQQFGTVFILVFSYLSSGSIFYFGCIIELIGELYMDYNLSTAWTISLIILVVWDLVWKGFALWRSGRSNQPGWFIALMIINSAGILPILYLLTHPSESK